MLLEKYFGAFNTSGRSLQPRGGFSRNIAAAALDEGIGDDFFLTASRGTPLAATCLAFNCYRRFSFLSTLPLAFSCMFPRRRRKHFKKRPYI